MEATLRFRTAVTIPAVALAAVPLAMAAADTPLYGPPATPEATVATPATPVAPQPLTQATDTGDPAALRAQVADLQRRLDAEHALRLRQVRAVRHATALKLRGARVRAAHSPEAGHAIALAAAAYHFSEDKLRRVATCESTLNPLASNGPYLGLFQFGAPLWATTPYRAFARTDPYANAMAAAWAFSRGMHRHWPICGYR